MVIARIDFGGFAPHSSQSSVLEQHSLYVQQRKFRPVLCEMLSVFLLGMLDGMCDL